MYPGDKLSDYATHNSIAWRTAHWQVLEANTVPITYFDGKLIPMPYLLMRHVATGRLVWVANFHNPASTRNRGDQSKWRAKAKAAQVALANKLHQTGVPLIITGDMNERGSYHCSMTSLAPMRAANGGSVGTSRCVAPRDTRIDWIFGSDFVRFTNYVAQRTPLIRRTTDHPVVMADLFVPVGVRRGRPCHGRPRAPGAAVWPTAQATTGLPGSSMAGGGDASTAPPVVRGQAMPRLCETEGLTDIQEEILKAVRVFVDEKILPVATELEHKDEYPTEIVEGLKELGVFGLMIPEEYGGLGESLLTYALAVEEIARGWMSVSGVINTHFIVAYMLMHHGTEEQKQKYLPRMATGEVRGAFSMSEPGCGSDVAAITTKAVSRASDGAPETTRSPARRCG